MQINGIDYVSQLNQMLQNRGIPSAPGAATASALQQQDLQARQTELYQTRVGMVDLSDKLSVVEDLIRTTTTRRARAATAISKADLELDIASLSSAFLKSTEEVNTTATSFSTFGPSWNGSSAALSTLDGVYDGSQGTDTLTFKVKKAGVHGIDNLKIEIRRGDGSKLEDIDIFKNDPIDQQYTLSNGIIFSLGPGSLSKNDTLTLDVYDSIGSVVDPDKPLGGVRNDNPNLEYGLTVTDGSFEVNGINILVTTSDSLSDILERITSSAAGVTASFDPVTESVVLTQKNPGSDYSITVGNDSSGFLAASKLSGAIVTPGTNGNALTPLSEIDAFNEVTSGTILVNDIEVSFDVDTDSLNDVLERITGSDAAVDAFTIYNSYVVVKANDRKALLNLKDTDTGFFAALRMREGDYRPVEGGKIAKTRAREITRAVADASESFNHMFRVSSTGGTHSEPVQVMRRQIEDAVSKTLNAVEEQKIPDLGIRFDFTTTETTASFGEQEQDTFESNLERYFVGLRELLIGPNPSQRGGLLGKLIEVLRGSVSRLSSELGSLGLLINTFA